VCSSDLNPNSIDEYEIADCYLYIDEFHKIRSGALDATFAEARKYRLNLTIAHQYLRQLNQNTLDAVIGNAGTTISFRASAKDAEILAEQSREYAPQAYTNLSNGSVIASCLQNGEPLSPVIANTFQLSGYSKRRAELIRNVSSYKYGRDRGKVETAINRELGIEQVQDAISEQNIARAVNKSQNAKIRKMVKQLARDKQLGTAK